MQPSRPAPFPERSAFEARAGGCMYTQLVSLWGAVSVVWGSRLPEHLLKDAGFYTSNK